MYIFNCLKNKKAKACIFLKGNLINLEHFVQVFRLSKMKDMFMILILLLSKQYSTDKNSYYHLLYSRFFPH